MKLDDNDLEMISHTLIEYQWAVDRVKYATGAIRECLDNCSGLTPDEQVRKIRDCMFADHGILESLERLAANGMISLETEPVATIIDNMYRKYRVFPLNIENSVMDPVSFYINDELVGIARNGEAYRAGLKQVAGKQMSGVKVLVRDEFIDVTPDGKLAHEPKSGPVVPDDTMEYLHQHRGVTF